MLANAVRSDPKLKSPGGVIAERPAAEKRWVWYIALLVSFLASCGGGAGEPEAELRAWVAAAEEEAEDRDRRALIARVADGYLDGRGNNRDSIDKLFRYYFLRQQSVVLLSNIETIEVFGETAAEITLTVGMAGSTGGLNLSADAWRFELELERREGEWLLIGARYGALGEELR